MLLDFIGAPVCVNKVPALQDLRINIAPNHQIRAKATCIDANGLAPPQPIDIVVYEWTNPSLENFALSININGKELVKNQSFKLKLGFNFMKKTWKLKGKFNGNPVDESMDSILEILPIIQRLAMSN